MAGRTQKQTVIILGAPRTGSSMVAGIFHAHGVFTGICREGSKYNEKGFFENLAIRKFFRMIFGVVEKPVEPFPVKQKMHDIMEKEGCKGKWLWKGSALYYPAFWEFNPTYVLCRRPTKQIFESLRGSKGIFGKDKSDAELLSFIDEHQKMMDQIPGVEVFTDKVANGDFSSIEKALEKAGIKPDFKKIDDFVDKDLWHYNS